jgi:hypothetical protein
MKESPKQTYKQHNFRKLKLLKTYIYSSLNYNSMITSFSFTNNISPPLYRNKNNSYLRKKKHFCFFFYQKIYKTHCKTKKNLRHKNRPRRSIYQMKRMILSSFNFIYIFYSHIFIIYMLEYFLNF